MAAEWYDIPITDEAELVDRVACLGNGMKFSWSDQDREEMRTTAKIIIDNVVRFYALDRTRVVH